MIFERDDQSQTQTVDSLVRFRSLTADVISWYFLSRSIYFRFTD